MIWAQGANCLELAPDFFFFAFFFFPFSPQGFFLLLFLFLFFLCLSFFHSLPYCVLFFCFFFFNYYCKQGELTRSNQVSIYYRKDLCWSAAPRTISIVNFYPAEGVFFSLFFLTSPRLPFPVLCSLAVMVVSVSQRDAAIGRILNESCFLIAITASLNTTPVIYDTLALMLTDDYR